MTGRGVPVTETCASRRLDRRRIAVRACRRTRRVRRACRRERSPGALVGRVLPAIFYAGVVIGSLIVILDLIGRRRDRGGGPAAGAVSALACAVAQLVVGTRIDRLRAAIGGPLDALAAR